MFYISNYYSHTLFSHLKSIKEIFYEIFFFKSNFGYLVKINFNKYKLLGKYLYKSFERIVYWPGIMVS